MKVSNSLLKISGNRIKLLAEAVNSVRPGVHIDVAEWKKMQPEVRRLKLTTFFVMNGFTEDELRQINRNVFRIKIPFKLILICLTVAIITFISLKVYQFLELPRIYAIGNDVAVTTAMDSSGRVVKQLDLYGKSNAGQSTDYSMIMIMDSGANYVVKDNNFFDWFLGKAPNYYVSKKSFVSKKTEYNEYMRIFQKAKGSGDLDLLTAEDRIAIKTCIENSTELFNAVLEVNKDSTSAYMPFLVANGMDNQRYIFLCFRMQNNQLYNVKVVCQQGLFNGYKEISSNVGTKFYTPLQWKLEAGQQFPIIYFHNPSTRETYQSLFPPYDTFLRS